MLLFTKLTQKCVKLLRESNQQGFCIIRKQFAIQIIKHCDLFNSLPLCERLGYTKTQTASTPPSHLDII